MVDLRPRALSPLQGVVVRVHGSHTCRRFAEVDGASSLEGLGEMNTRIIPMGQVIGNIGSFPHIHRQRDEDKLVTKTKLLQEDIFRESYEQLAVKCQIEHESADRRKTTTRT